MVSEILYCAHLKEEKIPDLEQIGLGIILNIFNI